MRYAHVVALPSRAHALTLLSLLTLACWTPVAWATYVPPSLSPGDTYHLVFITDGTRDATATTVTPYNTFVQTEAALNPSLTGTNVGVTYRAIVSTTALDANANAPVTAPVFNLNGDKIADNFADMWDGTIDNPIDYNQYAATIFPPDIWTGSQTGGQAFVGAEMGAANPRTGRADLADGRWIDEIIATNTYLSRFYGLSQELTVPVPEPSSLVLAAGALGSLLLLARRRRQATGR